MWPLLLAASMQDVEQRPCQPSKCLIQLYFQAILRTASSVRGQACGQPCPRLRRPDRGRPTALATVGPRGASSSPVNTNSTFAIDVPDSLLRRAQDGELRAFEQLYRLFERPVFTLALRLVGEPDSAREVLHDAMLKLFQRLHQIRFESPYWGR